jgi:hypothetical protein
MPPSVTGLSPATIISTVLLPQPECPMIETNSPSRIFRLKFFTITAGPFGVG